MQPETFYHPDICRDNHANGFENLFQNSENYHYFLQQWGKYIVPVAESYAYCLMPNHFHFLIRTKSEDEVQEYYGFEEGTFGKFQTFQKLVSKQFSNLFSSYTQAFNKQQNRKGSLFRPNFKNKAVEDDAYFTTLVFYIHHNPVHHGFVSNVLYWPHSSIHAILSKKPTQLKRAEVLNWFGGVEEFKKFHQQELKELEKLEMEFT